MTKRMDRIVDALAENSEEADSGRRIKTRSSTARATNYVPVGQKDRMETPQGQIEVDTTHTGHHLRYHQANGFQIDVVVPLKELKEARQVLKIILLNFDRLLASIAGD